MKENSPAAQGRRKDKTNRFRLSHSTALKVSAFIVAVVMICLIGLAVVGVVTMFRANVYQSSKDANKDDIYSKSAYNDCYNLILLLSSSDYGENNADDFIKYSNIGMVVSESANPDYPRYERNRAKVDERFVYTFYWYIEYNDEGDIELFRSIGSDNDHDEYPPESVYSVTLGISSELTETDDYFWYGLLIDVLYTFRFWVYPLGALALLTAIICIAFLMVAAGRRSGAQGVSPSMLTKIPFEIPTAAYAAIVLLGLAAVDGIGGSIATVVSVIWFVAVVIASLFWLMSLSLRLKLGSVVKNTILYRLAALTWRGICFLGRCIRTLIVSIPLIWKTVILLIAVTAIEFVVIAFTQDEPDNLLIWWLVGKLIACVAVAYIAIMLSRLKLGGKRIADGDLDYKVDVKPLILDLKAHGEDLNRIGEGLNNAVEERLRSERMKTELITNVSHDIKTPLTSIINYSDLICREECDNANIKEYASVLHNQSERMKRLIEDLVEASKASSGNIEIELSECDAGVLISQLSGEYDQRLSDVGLELVCSLPKNEVKIMADGRRIWRVFDNLMGNARKYALTGTRVYVSLEDNGEDAVFIFKNISREALAVDVNELTERFVRGDKSRNTEGNGLGLSIAKSLTELQGGSFRITLDGDLFKVTLSFPKVKNGEA